MAVKLDSPGPIFFRQRRHGFNNEVILVWKFRSMRHDMADACATRQVTYGDERVTRLGRFIRKTSLDELPQLFNVLAGSMSVVGPRPLVPGEGESVEDFVERRAQVKPGVTGLWQVSGRSDLPEEERIRLDHYYVDNWSCVLDLVITWRTARAVLQRKGAY